MAKFTVIRIAENGQGRLLRVSQHSTCILAGKRAWCWLSTSLNPNPGLDASGKPLPPRPWALDDTFEIPDGMFKYVPQEIESPDGETVTITQLELAD